MAERVYKTFNVNEDEFKKYLGERIKEVPELREIAIKTSKRLFTACAGIEPTEVPSDIPNYLNKKLIRDLAIQSHIQFLYESLDSVDDYIKSKGVEKASIRDPEFFKVLLSVALFNVQSSLIMKVGKGIENLEHHPLNYFLYLRDKFALEDENFGKEMQEAQRFNLTIYADLTSSEITLEKTAELRKKV